MATYTYSFTTGGNTGTITITTSNTLTTYDPGGTGTSYTGYPVTGISGSFNGQTITALLPSDNNMSNPLTNDLNGTGGNAGQYDNVLWNGNNQGNAGQSYYGIDNRGIAFTAGGTDYKIYKPTASPNSFAYMSNNVSNQATTFNPAASMPECFLTGTRILTAGGEVAVQHLRVGDLAVTASGALRPITWIGRRDLGGAGKPMLDDQQPVRVRAGAFGFGLPIRDLRLSPGHPVLVGGDTDCQGGHLVPIMCLINGTSVVREPSSSLTYWHVEVDAHDLLRAEGLAAESYYDMGGRSWFEGDGGKLADPDFVPAGEHGRCRPVAIDGTVVEAERQRLDAVFALRLSGACEWPDRGETSLHHSARAGLSSNQDAVTSLGA